MNIFDAIIQGIVQGLTEFLPVSSSGHLSITQHILGVQENNVFFNVMLHLGTLAAVVAVYYKLIIRLIKSFCLMVKDIFTGKFKWSEMDADRNLVVMMIIALIPLFLLFLPVPGTDMKIKDLADMWSTDGYSVIVALALLATSALLIVGINANRKTTQHYKKLGIMRSDGAGRRKYNPIDAAFVGIVQLVAAIFPGLSRSGSTLVASEIRGMNKQRALDFSFVLGVPTILAAAVVEAKDVMFDGQTQIDYFPVIIGMITSALVGFFAIKLFNWLLKTNRMYIFVIYTAVVGAVLLIISIIELICGMNIFTHQPLTF